MAEHAQTDTLLKKAALLRANGLPWAKVAELVGREEGTCRHWPGEHPEKWRAFYAAAESTAIEEAAAEALKTEREMLGGDDRQLAQRAAHSILAFRKALFAQRHEVSGPEGKPQELVLKNEWGGNGKPEPKTPDGKLATPDRT